MQFRRQDAAVDQGTLPADDVETTARARPDSVPRPLTQRPTIRLGAYAWAVVGIVAVVVLVMLVIGQLSIVTAPLVLALFPAAVLNPLAVRLKTRGLRDALVAALLVVGTLLVISATFTVLVPVVSGQIDDLSAQFNQGIEDLRMFLARGPFGLAPIDLNDLIEQARERIQSADMFSSGAVTSVAGQAGRFLTGLILFVIALFFYLKDGPLLAAWLRRQFPHSLRDDASAIGVQVWTTIGSYFRGQLLVALIDAIGITIGLLILRVPLALPIGVLVLFGGLFPLVGAFVSGSVAVIVSLATQGPVTALIVLGVVLGVQQLEGNLLQPLILGRATQLHPLAVVGSLIAGGALFGILGAFLAVPVVASAWRTIGYLRARVPG
ncbi:MAG TPA: AI-2E family transporter [Euzebyales bacterium]|nr:AI-2E family transporter [Euzebyales bacterium]